jgi:hypothetical protein
MEAGWEKTLTGIPKEIYQLWQEYLQRRGYKIALGFLGTRRWMSALGPGCVKTPMSNLRVEGLSRLR